MIAFYAMAALMLVPQMLRGCGVLSEKARRVPVMKEEKKKPALSDSEKLAVLAASNARLRTAAESGDVRAQLRLAIALYHGFGMPIDRPESKR